jgi:hypothetical protein
LASSAWAKTVHYDGKLEATNGGNVHFDVVKRNGRPRRVKNVTFDALKMHCEDGINTFVGSSFADTGRVSRNGRFKLSDGNNSFTGLIGDGRHAHGKITVHFQHMFHGECVNKQHDWSAKRA